MKKNLPLLSAVCFLIAGSAAAPLHPQDPLASVLLPPGFSIGLFADGIPGARQLALGADGTVFVGTRGDAVWALKDANGDFRAEEKRPVLRGLLAPNGVAWRGGELYVAEINRVSRVELPDGIAGPVKRVTVYADLPDLAHHGLKYIRFGPEGKLYLPLGMPCNVCRQSDERFGTIRRLEPDGSRPEIVARGIRNSVGFDFHPATGELWFTDNGRDHLGDDLPPDELNRAARAGLHFGFPYFHGRAVKDPDFGREAPAGFSYSPPVQELGAHVAALGMTFYTGTQFPERYRRQIFIAEHGSWNRSSPAGYRISLVELAGDKAVGYSAFADGFRGLPGRGRPVDVLIYTDGSLLVSDDSRGAVYRISYRP